MPRPTGPQRGKGGWLGQSMSWAGELEGEEGERNPGPREEGRPFHFWIKHKGMTQEELGEIRVRSKMNPKRGFKKGTKQVRKITKG